MFLKKDKVHNLFLKYDVFNINYNDIEELKIGILKLCKLLEKDIVIFKIFSNDGLNDQFFKVSKKVINYKNFNYYLISDIEIINEIDFNKLRFLEIYSNQKIDNDENVEKMLNSYSFNIGLDNYLEYTKIIINLNDYDSSIISKIEIE